MTEAIWLLVQAAPADGAALPPQVWSSVAGIGQADAALAATRALTAVYDRLRADLRDLDAQLARGSDHEPGLWRALWDVLPVAERNPLRDPLIARLCLALALIEAVRSGSTVRVAIDTPAAAAFVRVLRRAGLEVRIEGGEHLVLRLRRAAWTARHRLGALWRSAVLRLRERRAARSSVGAASGSIDMSGIGLVIASWAGNHETAGETDRWLGRLPEALAELGRPVLRLAIPDPTVVERISLCSALAALPGVLPIPVLWRRRDIAAATLVALIAPLACRFRLQLAGIDLSPLLRQSLGSSWAHPALLDAWLWRSIGPALSRSGLICPDLLLPYENQCWERAAWAGWRRAFPQARIFGCNHAPFAWRYTAFFRDARQRRNDTAWPDKVLLCGERYRRWMLADGVPTDRCPNIGAWRYPGLAAPSASLPPRSTPTERTPGLLATFSITLPEALALGRLALQIARDAGAGLTCNFHPMMSAPARAVVREQLLANAEGVPLRFDEQPAGILFGQADLVLCSATTTVFEAAAAGVPVLEVCADGGIDLRKSVTPDELLPEITALSQWASQLLSGADFPAASCLGPRAALTECLPPPDAVALAAAFDR